MSTLKQVVSNPMPQSTQDDSEEWSIDAHWPTLVHGLADQITQSLSALQNNLDQLLLKERITRLAAYLHLPSPGFDSFLAFVLKLRKDIGVPHTLFVPIGAILGIYARENGQGMVFDLESPFEDDEAIESEDGDDVPPPDTEPPRPSGRPSLKVVK